MLIELDGTPNKAEVAATLGVSLAVAAATASIGLPLYRPLGR